MGRDREGTVADGAVLGDAPLGEAVDGGPALQVPPSVARIGQATGTVRSAAARAFA
jgi:hypothetical protein